MLQGKSNYHVYDESPNFDYFDQNSKKLLKSQVVMKNL